MFSRFAEKRFDSFVRWFSFPFIIGNLHGYAHDRREGGEMFYLQLKHFAISFDTRRAAAPFPPFYLSMWEPRRYRETPLSVTLNYLTISKDICAQNEHKTEITMTSLTDISLGEERESTNEKEPRGKNGNSAYCGEMCARHKSRGLHRPRDDVSVRSDSGARFTNRKCHMKSTRPRCTEIGRFLA